MIKEFYNDDSAYDANIRNTGGKIFVYNDFPSKDIKYRKVHGSDCSKLNNVRDGKKTSYRKICCNDLNELIQYITKRDTQKIGYSFCHFCMPSQCNNPNDFHTKEMKIIEEKCTTFSKYEALAVAQTLTRIYNEKKLPRYYDIFYKPLGLTKNDIEANPNKLYRMIVIAAYDLRPFTIVAKGWEQIWGTKREDSSIYAKLNDANLLDMEITNTLPTDEIRNRLKKEKFNGCRIDSNGSNTDYARTIKDAVHVVKDCDLLDLMIEAKTSEEVKTIFDLVDTVHGIGPTIASKLIMYLFREIGIGQMSPSNLYPAVLPILKEFHNSKLVKELEQRYGEGFINAIFENLKELGDPFAIDALYYIDRDEPLLKDQLFEASKSVV